MMRFPAVGVALRIAGGLALIALVAFAGVAGSAANSQESQSVSVVASWTGSEGADFTTVLREFMKQTGIKVNYTGTRALDQLLQSDIQQGNPPDLAILPSPGTLLSYAQRGYLTPLDARHPVLQPKLTEAYDAQWLSIMRLGTDRIYTLPVKADLQNLVWYNPKLLAGDSVPGQTKQTSWADLTSLEGAITAKGGTPWCLGMDSPPTSGWLGTDWISDILLHQSGTTVYQQWANGTLDWTSPQVTAAWKAWGSLVTGSGQVSGGPLGALVTNWADAGEKMFGKDPGCSLQYVPSFITVEYGEFPERPRAGTGYNFFPSPMTGLPDATSTEASDAWNVSADLLGMFHDTPAARQLVQYLAGTEAQGIWPHIPAGGAASANSQVKLGVYPDKVDATIAQIMNNPGATLCFNASDLMPPTMQNAFYEGVMEYLWDPGQLTAILQRLEKVRQAVYQPKNAFQSLPTFTCGTPAAG